uniref:hypothetical protein Ycf36 n=1 Tax=Chlorobotrys sp. TaxID=2859677 RepID=UPI002181FB9D|nr:hypothetical protein Ycf36 [Chlorobotrys sp.]UVI60877.1 hypothetical protein Ycf36 [Chlorobotrys sp.]
MIKFDEYNLCPVPYEQRPFYEYLNRKESTFLAWVQLNEIDYITKFFLTFFIIFTLIFPLINWFISFSFYPIYTILLSMIFSLIIQGLLYINLFIAWKYIGNRLFAEKIFYEESGYSDGKVWNKPPTILRHERLLYYYQILPFLTRIEKTLQLIVVAVITFISLFFVLMY